MIHLCINSPLHHIHHINDLYLSIGFHFDIYHSHKGLYLYIVHQSSINQSFDINQSLDINQSNHWHQWQHDTTIPPFGIDGNTNIDVNTNYQLLMSTCRYDMLYINSQCDYFSPSININVINSPPLTSMAKGHSHLGATPLAWTLLGVAPPIWIPLIFLWIISALLNKGYHSDVMLKIHQTYSPCDHRSPWNYASVLFLQI